MRMNAAVVAAVVAAIVVVGVVASGHVNRSDTSETADAGSGLSTPAVAMATSSTPAVPTPTEVATEPTTGAAVDRYTFTDEVYNLRDRYLSNEVIAVDSDAPARDLRRALTRASERMMLVGEDGVEYDQDAEELLDGEIYTPNYASDVRRGADGALGFYVDCKGYVEPAMATTFRRVLVEEFEAARIGKARVWVPDDEE